jgi:hypothetical protein
MWFSLVILIIIQPSESVIQLEQHFRPLGKVATGLTYAHLSAQINVSSLEHAFTSLVQTIILREKGIECHSGTSLACYHCSTTFDR